MQRMLDLLLSLFALMLVSPFLIPIILLLSVTGEGKIFYRQERVGKGNKVFLLLKFATMLEDSPNLGAGNITVKDDPRVLPVGRFLRKSKINEIPQLLNILFGDMSFIGPRPLTRDNFQAYSEKVQLTISAVRPGLSGAGSIIFRNEELLFINKDDNKKFYYEVIAPFKGELESWYVKNNTIINYLILIVLTVFVVLFPNSNLFWQVFPTAPKPKEPLASNLLS